MDPSTPSSSSLQPPDPSAAAAAGAAFPQNLDLSQLSSLDFSSMLSSFDLNNDIDLLSENTADLSVLSPVVSKPPSPSPAASSLTTHTNPQSSLSPRMLNQSLKVTGRPRSHSVPVPPTNLDLTMSFDDDSDGSISPAAEGPDSSSGLSSPAHGASEKTKKRTRASPEQLQVLESTFMQNPSPSAKVREQLAQKVGMSERSIQIWFQNRRAKVKLMQKRRLLWQTQLWHNSSPIYPGALQMNRYMPSPRVPIPRASSSIVGYHPNMNLATTANAVDDVRMFSAESLQVGGWRRLLTQNSPISPTSPPAGGDLTCLYDLSTKSFTWTIADAGYRFKLVVPFVIVTAIHFRPSPSTTDSTSGNPESELSFELSQPPNFFMSVTGADKSQATWSPCRDFTEAKQASTCLIHVIRGSTQLLHSQLTTLLQAEPSLAALYRSHQANHASPEVQVNGLQNPPVLNRRVSAPPVPVDLSPNLSMMGSLQANGNASVPTSATNSLSVPSFVPLQQSPTDSQPASLLPTPVTSPVNNLETTMVDPSQMGASMGLPIHNAVAEMRRMGRNRSASAPLMPSFRRAGNNLSAPNTPNPNHPLMASMSSSDLSQSAMSSPFIPTSMPAEMDMSFDLGNANVFSPFPNVRSARPSLALNPSNMSATSPNPNTSALSSTSHLDLAFSDKMLQDMAMSLNGQNNMLGGLGNSVKTDLAVTSAMPNNNEGTNSALSSLNAVNSSTGGLTTPSDLGLADNSLPSDLFGFNTGFGSQGSQLSGTSGSGSEEMDWNSLVGMIKFEGMSSISSA